MTDAATAFGLVFLAELGDKSMLLAIALSARHRAATVLTGIAIAALTLLGVSALAGGALAEAVPARWLSLGAGALFLVFGVLAWREGDEGEDDGERPVARRGPAVLGVVAAFLVAELGDKTMLATAAMAGPQAAVPTWLGASAGMTAASGLAVALSSLLSRRVPAGLVHRIAAVAFVLFGGALLLEGLRA